MARKFTETKLLGCWSAGLFAAWRQPARVRTGFLNLTRERRVEELRFNQAQKCGTPFAQLRYSRKHLRGRDTNKTHASFASKAHLDRL